MAARAAGLSRVRLRAGAACDRAHNVLTTERRGTFPHETLTAKEVRDVTDDERGVMSEVRRQILVEAAPSVTASTWSHFIQWILSGHQRLACDELACVDAVRIGMISFEPADSGFTTVVFRVDTDGDDTVSPQVLEQNMARDLVVFKDYIERGDAFLGKGTPSELRERQDREERKRHERHADHQARGYESASNKDMWPT